MHNAAWCKGIDILKQCEEVTQVVYQQKSEVIRSSLFYASYIVHSYSRDPHCLPTIHAIV